MSISPSEKIKVSIEGSIATVVVDNPSANTWDRESLPALKAVIEALNAEPTVYALVFTGAGEKFFSAGADLNQFASGDADVARGVSEAFGGPQILISFHCFSLRIKDWKEAFKSQTVGGFSLPTRAWVCRAPIGQ